MITSTNTTKIIVGLLLTTALGAFLRILFAARKRKRLRKKIALKAVAITHSMKAKVRTLLKGANKGFPRTNVKAIEVVKKRNDQNKKI